MEIDFGSEDIRRMPVYLLLDVSGSMNGAPIQAVEQGVQLLHDSLLNQPQAVELAYLSVITFASKAQQIIPLTPLLQFTPPSLSAGGATALGGALHTLGEALDNEIIQNSAERKGDYKPLIFLLTDGEPTDTWQPEVEALKARDQKKVGNIIALGCGGAVNTDILKQVTPQVLLIEDVTPDNLRAFFKWVSASVTTASQGVAAAPAGEENRLQLPPPPSGFEVIL
ncbi:MAG: VWA domain-containing protein [Chloroflexota bacterium]